ncbi:MAG: precorrin-8X methylmutase [Desulfovibrio sp.]|nr:precorrin-8X methylmutase [Desulfovibrio sp.]
MKKTAFSRSHLTETGEHLIALDPAMTPAEIEKASFACIEREIPEPRPFCGRLWEIARRCVHTSGDLDIVNDLRLTEAALEAGLSALKNGCTIFTDTVMAKSALTKRHLAHLNVTLQAVMEQPDVSDTAKTLGITRARAGVLAIADKLQGSIIVIGNAPTALLTLLECLDNGAKPPSLIIGMPVGFVNAAQSKLLLHQSPYPNFSLLGRKGGSALAACCVNAMAELISRKP